ncbi:hypothetical protein CWI42_060440 [Ordospora colligata]|uniref:Uncharacterized protein n=1 Tax=Ordospora colligata OC4 TaxID=1354746 RepID=A0A0B2UKK9_9MICR|nr:uncharacterized protein M896_060440 [Ordospora colligata OC4]KHN69545.1 hypothetical protein M896_060440 [Ordospora colligata OC4]TBU15365.1 hypothetical protein CWI41_060430 [Ordospora colligata]TBU15465.1 hypothetical protein CWI40_060430 [Ordospora colligata]TBU18561.1 hypothetical protein CWI42_060440 [Ordospora colligata]
MDCSSDSSSLDFPEFKTLPQINIQDLIHTGSIDECQASSGSDEYIKNNDIHKIHQYLDRDIVDQDEIIKKLIDLEHRLDTFAKIDKQNC